MYYIINLDNLNRILNEYKHQMIPLVKDSKTLLKLIVEATILYYCWNKDFIDVGLQGLPNVDDLDNVEEKNCHETVTTCIIEAMQLIDSYHSELRTICLNSVSVSIVDVISINVILFATINAGELH